MLTTRDIVESPRTMLHHWSGSAEVPVLPLLPLPYYGLLPRLRDAWEVLCGRAQAVRDTRGSDLW